MSRNVIQIIISGALLAVAILVIPEHFLFSQTVPRSFWTDYFPLPFGAGWFITFVLSAPVTWATLPLSKAVIFSMATVLLVMVGTVPVGIYGLGGSLTLNNLTGQYMWIAIIVVPPVLVHLSTRWLWGVIGEQWLTKQSTGLR